MKIKEPQLVEATVRLLANTDFQKLLDAMGNHTEELNEQLVMKPEMSTGDLHNLRGQTKNMVLLMKAITEAPSELQKLSQPKS